MKNILLFTFFAATLAGCSKDGPTGSREPVPVAMGGVIPEVGTDAVVNPGDAFTAQVVASVNANDFSIIYASGTPTAVDFDQTVNFSATGEATLDPTQYYPINGGYIYIRGFAPSATRTGSTVAYTIDGTQDIMVSDKASGNKNTLTAQSLTFSHLLTQVNFRVVAVDADAVADWGDILSIELLDQPNAFSLNLNTGILTPGATGAIPVPGSAATLTTTAADAGQVMFYPMSVSVPGPLKIRITSVNGLPGGREYLITSLPAFTNVLAAGHAYVITLSFKKTEFQVISVTPVPWATISWSSEMGS